MKEWEKHTKEKYLSKCNDYKRAYEKKSKELKEMKEKMNILRKELSKSKVVKKEVG